MDTTMFTDKKKLSLQDSLLQNPVSDPVLFFDFMNELSGSADLLCAITAASHYGIFDLLETAQTTSEITRFFPQKEMIFPLLNFLKKSGFIIEKDGEFQCTESATEFCSLSSPYSQVPYLDKLLWHLTEHWLNLEDIIRTGPRIYQEQEFYSRWSLPSMAANALTGRLQEVTRAVASLTGFSGFRKMIDLGGGHGLYALALARLNPDLQAVVFDLPEVIPLARDFIMKYDMQDQVTLMGGDFFVDPIGDGYDLILSSSNPSGKTPEMIPVIVSALNTGGYFINVQPGDQTPGEDLRNQLEWQLWTFSDTDIPKSSWGKKKRFFTPEYHQILTTSGLDVISVTSIPDPYIHGNMVTMIIAKKRD